MSLDKLSPPKGAVRTAKRVGRGNASGTGGTAGKGHKGQKARSGASISPGFEGGQMPLFRRLPKRGFTNVFRTEYAVINLRDLARYEAGQVVDPDRLVAERVVKKLGAGLKVLSDGDLTVALTVKAHKFSAKAKEKIQAAGGTAEEI
ncbi:MAG: 50S ribosomal protein L15 [Deltaproteobacteria bacterium]|nr:50S ribosomal protein L15 [Deltaproteobacteria bacterium]